MATERLVRIWLRRADEQRGTIQFVDFRDGTRAGLRSRYTAIDDRWRIWILALDASPIVGPLLVVPGIDLLQGHKHDPRVPQGQLFLYSPDREPPNKTTVDVDAILFYRRRAA